MKNFDQSSSIIKMATDILFVKNPVSTSMGTLLGIILHGGVSVLAPFFSVFELIRGSSITVFHYVAVGIFGLNLKNYTNRHKVKPEIEETIALIEKQASEGKISKLEAKQQYRVLIAQAVEDARISRSADGVPSSQN